MGRVRIGGRTRRWVVASVVAAVAVGLVALSCIDICPAVESCWPGLHIDVPAISAYLRSLGAWGAAASIGLMIVHAFVPFPAEILTLANGMVFGPLWGVAITWVGAMCGACLSFALTRTFGRGFAARLLGPAQMQRLDAWSQERAALPLLVSRLIPLISFNLINYAAGLTSVTWWSFLWTTAVGILPMTVFTVLMGSSVGLLPWWGWGLLLAGTGLAWLAWKRRRRADA